MSSPSMREAEALHSDFGSNLPTGTLTRRQMVAAGALLSAALVLPALPTRAQSSGDIAALRFLEDVMAFEAKFFTQTSTPGDALRVGNTNLMNLIAEQDGQQARWFELAQKRFGVEEMTVGTLSNPAPLLMEKPLALRFSSASQMLDEAISVKEVAVAAFSDAMASASMPELVQALAQLAGVQNRHLALLRHAKMMALANPAGATAVGATPTEATAEAATAEAATAEAATAEAATAEGNATTAMNTSMTDLLAPVAPLSRSAVTSRLARYGFASEVF